MQFNIFQICGVGVRVRVATIFVAFNVVTIIIIG
jgi:hypothetical protein